MYIDLGEVWETQVRETGGERLSDTREVNIA